MFFLSRTRIQLRGKIVKVRLTEWNRKREIIPAGRVEFRPAKENIDIKTERERERWLQRREEKQFRGVKLHTQDRKHCRWSKRAQRYGGEARLEWWWRDYCREKEVGGERRRRERDRRAAAAAACGRDRWVVREREQIWGGLGHLLLQGTVLILKTSLPPFHTRQTQIWSSINNVVV